jgi:hypothetical protein
MASATESTVSSILKEVYPGAIEDQLNNEVALWAIFEKSKETVGGFGKRVVRPMRITRNSGVGARPDNGTLPAAGNQAYVNAAINPATTYLVGQISGRTVRTSASDSAAFEQALSAEMRFGISDLATDLSRQLFMGAGQITTVNGAVTASTTIVVKDASNLSQGMILEFWNGATNQTTNDAGIVGTAIVTINYVTNTITVATAQTITTLAAVTRQGNNTAATTTYEMNGLDVTVDDNTDYPGRTYFGLNRATNSILYGNRLDISSASGVPGDSTTVLSENKLQYGVDQARKLGGGYVDLFITDYNTRRKYSNLLQGQKRYPVEGINSPQFAGGFERSKDLRANVAEGLSFDGAPFMASRQAIAGTIFGLDTKSWELIQQSDIEWVTDDSGRVLFQLINAATSVDAFRYSLFYDANLYCEAPDRNVKYVNA